MGQQEIYDFLKLNKHRSFTTWEIAKKMDVALASASHALYVLQMKGDIKKFDVRPMQYRYEK